MHEGDDHSLRRADYSVTKTSRYSKIEPVKFGLFSSNKIKSAINERDTRISNLEEQYAAIIDIDDAIEKSRNAYETLENNLITLKQNYAEKRKIYDALVAKVAVYDESLAFSELGVYEPHFNYDDSEAYKKAIQEIRSTQKAVVTAKEATIQLQNWTVDGSEAKGRTMANRQSKLMLRAFNNECEAAIANVRWNNVNAMEKRILQSQKAINDASKSVHIELNDSYVALKLDELYLTQEYREQLKVEKDERSEIARQEREEKKLQADAKRAEAEEQRYQALLEKAKKEAGTGEQTEEMRSKIDALEAELRTAQDIKLRAQSMAERTKSGFVYIISNIGSFGDNIVKIGLTRRLDPDDRVKELGDASVPFTFDTHAMIYSDNAPQLEAALHNAFDKFRVNATNLRKEFFYASLSQVEEKVKELAPDAKFFKDREAQEWHETLAKRETKLNNDNLPSEI